MALWVDLLQKLVPCFGLFEEGKSRLRWIRARALQIIITLRQLFM